MFSCEQNGTKIVLTDRANPAAPAFRRESQFCPPQGEIHYYSRQGDYYIPTTAENTSLSSANSLNSGASNEQSSSESLQQRRRQQLERNRHRRDRRDDGLRSLAPSSNVLYHIAQYCSVLYTAVRNFSVCY